VSLKMPVPRSIGALEFSCIGLGFEAQDEVLKAASVELLIARTICSGKYLLVIGGSVSDVQAAVHTGLTKADEAVIDHMIIANAHDSLFPTVGQSVVLAPEEGGALGVIETFSGTSVLAAADAAAKTANVIVFRIHVAMALGGQGLAAPDRQRGRRPRRHPGRCQTGPRARYARLPGRHPPAQPGAV
jgi:microcompartment protein CcmL/EutN